MKKQCMELFKNDVVKGEVTLFANGTVALALSNPTIEKIVEECKILLQFCDEVYAESDVVGLHYYDEESAYTTLIAYNTKDYMRGANEYRKEDSRTHLFDMVDECVKFMKKNTYIKEMLVRHQETFFCEEEIELVVSDVNEYSYILHYGTFYQDITTEEEFDDFCNKIYSIILSEY